MTETYHGACYCGAVTLRVTGSAVAEGFCHCNSCKAWSAAPMIPYMLFPQSAVEIAGGAEHLKIFDKSGNGGRAHCSLCGGGVFARIDAAGLTDVFAPVLTDYPFTPKGHVNYAERMMDVKDGLPKFADFPESFGGTGQMIEE